MTNGAKGDVTRLAGVVAMDESWSDYDLWRALKTINNELYRLERLRLPVPINVIYARQILRAARMRRAEA